MSTRVNQPKKIFFVTQAISSLANIQSQDVRLQNIQAAAERVFAVFGDEPNSTYSPEKQFFSALHEGNMRSLEQEVKNGWLSEEARLAMMGNESAYLKSIDIERARLDSSPITLDPNSQDEINHLLGALEDVMYQIDDELISAELNYAIKAFKHASLRHAMSLNEAYPDALDPLIYTDIMSLNNDGCRLIGIQEGFRMLYDKLTYEDNSDRVHYGSDVLQGIAKSVVEDKPLQFPKRYRAPLEPFKTADISHRPLFNTGPDIPKSSTAALYRFARLMQDMREQFDKYPIEYFDGDVITDDAEVGTFRHAIENMTNSFNLQVTSNHPQFQKGFELSFKQDRDRDAEMSL